MTIDSTSIELSDDLDEGLVEQEGEPRNLYGSVYEFVHDFLSQVYAHDVKEEQTSWRWCSHWFHHAEAVARLEACWKAFEVLRLDPGTGASVWFRDHADPCMNALTDPAGPFARCSGNAHKLPKPLPLADPPLYLLQASCQQ